MELSTISGMIAIVFIFWTVFVEAQKRNSQNHHYENLALNRRASLQPQWLNTNLDVGHENAVDGLFFDRGTGGQCAISADNALSAIWYVDLGSVLSISHVDIYYRTDNQPSPTIYTSRMAGFSLYISNTTSKEDGHLCFHEIQNKTGTPTEDQTISCPVHGRYVIYYNERRPDVEYPSYYSQFAYIELCEVEVYGCRESGYFGVDCSLACPKNCQDRRCHIHTGYCLGCLPGYKGGGCNEVCSDNKYGMECALSCGNCNDGKPCNNVNGKCHLGCNEGVHGDLCQDKCSLGNYGKNCEKTCSENCNVPRRCDKVTGQCDGGCQPGWNSITCDQKCGTGTFGNHCRQDCGSCLNANHCHHINGTCLEGCLPGYKGKQCKEKCSAGEYGNNCSKKCSTFCRGSSSCDPMTGVCIEGCEEGWSGPLCGKGSSSGVASIRAGIVIHVVIFAIITGVF